MIDRKPLRHEVTMHRPMSLPNVDGLNSTQRAQVAVDLIPEVRRRAMRGDITVRRKDGSHDFEKSSYSIAILSSLLDVAQHTISEAKRLRREAPDLTQDMRDGKMTVWRAHTLCADRNGTRRSRSTAPIQTTASATAVLNSCKNLLLHEDAAGLAAGVTPQDRDEYVETLRSARTSITRIIRELEQS